MPLSLTNFAVLGIAAAGVAAAMVDPFPKSGPELLGRSTAAFTTDHDGIVLRGFHDPVRHLKFAVQGAPLELTRVVATYDQGEPAVIQVHQLIHAGGESAVIDLTTSGARILKRIDYWYDTRGTRDGAAHVAIYGMK